MKRSLKNKKFIIKSLKTKLSSFRNIIKPLRFQTSNIQRLIYDILIIGVLCCIHTQLSQNGASTIPLLKMFMVIEWRAIVPHDKKEIHQMRSPRTAKYEATLNVMSFSLKANAWSYFFLFSGIPRLLSLNVNAVEDLLLLKIWSLE